MWENCPICDGTGNAPTLQGDMNMKSQQEHFGLSKNLVQVEILEMIIENHKTNISEENKLWK